MTELVKNAIAERAKLELELSRNPVFQRIKMLDAIIANFPDNSSNFSTKTTKRDQIHVLAKECIRITGKAKLADIHAFIEKRGMTVNIGMLKSYMYKYADIKNSREGFAIKHRPSN